MSHGLCRVLRYIPSGYHFNALFHPVVSYVICLSDQGLRSAEGDKWRTPV